MIKDNHIEQLGQNLTVKLKKLVAKAKTINRYLGSGYKVMATPTQGWTFDNSEVDLQSIELIEIIVTVTI